MADGEEGSLPFVLRVWKCCFIVGAALRSLWGLLIIGESWVARSENICSTKPIHVFEHEDEDNQ